MSKAEELEGLKKKIENAALPLKENHNLVFGKGSADATVMLIGEAPGEREDAEGIPFVGSAGKQLDRLLSAAGLSVDDVYIANILKYRPPDNRDPNEEEVRAHTPYLVGQIKIIRPMVIVTLGNFATKFVLASFDTDKMNAVEGISKLRGKVRKITLESIPLIVLPTYHPAAILYNPNLRAELEEDFALLGKIMKD